jgi:hypothetical protein
MCVSSLAACEAQVRPKPQPRGLDKQALYADASLLPTREGERVRRELALAGELREAIELLELDETRVDVELGQPARVVVVARMRGDRPDALEQDVRAIATAIVPAPVDVHVQLVQGAIAAAPVSAPSPPAWALALTCLGLGLSLGVTAERLLARRRALARG